MEKWLNEHINDISIEDLLEYESMRQTPGYVAISFFFVGLGPQYWFLSQDFFKKYVRRDLKGKIVAGVIGVFPSMMGILAARPYQRRKKAFLKNLMDKYKED